MTKNEYKNGWIRENLDRVNLTMPKGKKNSVKEIAESNGESLNSFINRAIDMAIVFQHKGAGCMDGQNNFYNYFIDISDEELRVYYQEYLKFQDTGVIPEGCKLRDAADFYKGNINGCWTIPFATDLLETIANRWMENCL